MHKEQINNLITTKIPPILENMIPGDCNQDSPEKVEEEEIFAEEKKQPKVNFVKKNEERLRKIQE